MRELDMLETLRAGIDDVTNEGAQNDNENSTTSSPDVNNEENFRQ